MQATEKKEEKKEPLPTTLLCKEHKALSTLFCDEEGCRAPICSKCVEGGAHNDHQVYGVGNLKKKNIGQRVSKKRDSLIKLKANSMEEAKKLDDYKATCEVYNGEIERIFQTELGMALMSNVAGSKDDLTKACGAIMDKVKEFQTLIKEIPAKVDEVLAQLTLTTLLIRKGTFDEYELEKELRVIADPATKEGKALLKKIQDENLKDQLDEFKEKMANPGKTTAKKAKKKGKRVQDDAAKDEAKGKKKKEE